ncbi:MAG: AMP-binding protein, partial [Halobacteriaceae archaeon]
MPVHSHGSRPYEWVGDWSGRRASLSPDRVGLIDRTTGNSFTYAELDERAQRMGHLLIDHGVTEGDRVAVIARNRPAVLDLFFACGKTGGVLAPLSHRLAAPELGTLLTRVDPALVVVETPFASKAEAALSAADVDAPVRAIGEADGMPWPSLMAERPATPTPVEGPALGLDDPYLLLHTGGSTGTPKETILSHGGIYWNSMNTITAWGIREDDRTPMVFPLFHTGGWNVITIPLFHMGGTVVIAREFDPGTVLETIDDTAATILIAVPAVLRMMTEHDAWDRTDLSSIRIAKSGGGPCRQTVLEAYWDRDVDLSQGYGLTECGPNNFAMPDDWPREKADSVGRPGMHVDTRIVDEEGTPLPVGEIGELQLASPHAAAGYWENPGETEATFGDGWVSTGDLARVDEAGYHYIEGRTSNMFVSGGENVYPAAVEDAIAGHPKVEDVIVIGVPDETWGQVGKAVVQGDESLSLSELRAFLEDRLAA